MATREALAARAKLELRTVRAIFAGVGCRERTEHKGIGEMKKKEVQ